MNTTDIIETFADGEAVDPIALDRALADPDGRAHLIDLLVLRGFARTPPVDAAALPSPGGSRTARWLSLAAAVAVVATLGGYFAGARRAASQLNAVPGAAVSGTTAPAPTQVITLEPGRDWTEHQGGF